MAKETDLAEGRIWSSIHLVTQDIRCMAPQAFKLRQVMITTVFRAGINSRMQ